MASLTRDAARARRDWLDVESYRVELDLDAGPTTFGSTTTIWFRCRDEGAATFLDVAPRDLLQVTLNGRDLDVGALADRRLELTDLAQENELVCRATMAYRRDGQGLHRSVDPADGEAYVYGHCFLDAAPTVFACFDQPDLKGRFTVQVTAPAGWSVVGNGAATQVAPGRWELATTPPISTYVVTVCAGPWVTRRGEHDGIPLALHARRSLEEPLDRWAAGLLELTGEGFDRYHALFGIRYPFGEYHQVFVPEFNATAMENPGCVTMRDDRLFRGSPTDDQLLTRARTVLHEQAHMWFGDLVTMRWWDDLWLNESFAEYMSSSVLAATGEYPEAWASFGIVRKTWGYAAERRPSTHPVAGSPALDAAAALQNFDGISYAKGASVLRQLASYLGEPAFIGGVSAYLREHEFGNGTFADLVAALEAVSGEELESWCAAWLLTADRDRLRVDTVVEDGVITSATLHRHVPEAHPADRIHVVDVVGWTDGAEQLRTLVRTTGDVTALPELEGRTRPAVLVPNASDLTWAGVDLDPATIAALGGELSRIPESAARVVIWSALVDAVCLGSMDPRSVLGLMETELAEETSAPLLERLALTAVRRFVPEFLVEREHDAAWQRLADAADRVLAEPEDPSATIIAARTVAQCSGDERLLRRWLAGRDVPDGLGDDADLRWLVAGNLARRGALPASELESLETGDRTMTGRLAALHARAAAPTPDAKAWAWEQVVSPQSRRSNYELIALLEGFWLAPDLALVRPYVERFFAEVPLMSGWVGDDALARVVRFGFPKVVERDTLRLAESALAHTGLSPATRRNIDDGASTLAEAVLSRERYAPQR